MCVCVCLFGWTSTLQCVWQAPARSGACGQAWCRCGGVGAPLQSILMTMSGYVLMSEIWIWPGAEDEKWVLQFALFEAQKGLGNCSWVNMHSRWRMKQTVGRCALRWRCFFVRRAWPHDGSFSASLRATCATGWRFQSIEFHIMPLNPECVYLAACRLVLIFLRSRCLSWPHFATKCAAAVNYFNEVWGKVVPGVYHVSSYWSQVETCGMSACPIFNLAQGHFHSFLHHWHVSESQQWV